MNRKANNLKLLTQLLKGTRNMYECNIDKITSVKMLWSKYYFLTWGFTSVLFTYVKLHIIYAPLHGHGMLLIEKKQGKIEW